MRWGFWLLLAFGLAFVGVLAYFLYKLKRHWDNFSEQAAQRMQGWSEEVDSMPERWHEYDETYQHYNEALSGGQSHGPGSGKSATLGPRGGKAPGKS